jgi:uncharacterized protein involved in exopolysaccharide biosynthesis
MTTQTAAADEAFDARRLIADMRAVVSRRKGLMLAVFLAAFVGGMAILFTRALGYRAEVFLLVSGASPPTGVTPVEVPVVADVLSATRSRSVATHMAVIKSPAVLGRAYRSLAPRFRRVFAREGLSVTAESPEGADIIKVAVRSRDAAAAAALANALAQQHIGYTRRSNSDLVRSALSFLEAELGAAREKVDQAQRALLAAKRDTRLFSPDEQINAKTVAAAAAEQRADEAALERRVAQMQIARLRKAIASGPAERVSATGEEINPLLQQLRSAITDMKVSRVRTLVDFAPGSPEMRQIDEQIKAAEGLLSAEKRRLLRQIEAKDEAFAARERDNRKLRERYVNELNSLNSAQTRLLRLSSTVELLRENYRLLRERRQNLAMGAQARLPDVSVLAPAEVPKEPAGPGKAVQALFVVFVSVLLACIAAWLAELLGPRPEEAGSAAAAARA